MLVYDCKIGWRTVYPDDSKFDCTIHVLLDAAMHSRN